MRAAALCCGFLASGLIASGCATGVPQAIREAPATAVSVTAARGDAPRYLGQRVRWGGTILAVRNREELTEIEILSRPLRQDGEPRADAAGEGRFIAEIDRFLDPAEYPQDRRLTVTGRLNRIETRPVGDYPYRYPVVAAEGWHLWPEEPERVALPPYFYPYPWYDPWYFGPYRHWHYYPW